MLQWLNVMNRLINLSFILLAFILDLILQSFFPVDFEYRRLFVVFNTGIIALMLTIRKENFLTVLLVAFSVGLLLDFVRYGYFFLSALSFSLTLVIARLWSNQVNDTTLELMILSVIVVFLKELILYGLLALANLTFLYPSTWFIYRAFLTILMHIPLSLMVIYFNRLRLLSLDRNLKARHKQETTLSHRVRKS